MNALKPRPPFQVLVMSEESRLGREAIETAYALKQLVDGRRARVLLPRGPRAHARLPHRQDHAVADGVRRRTRAREGAAAHVRRDAAEGARPGTSPAAACSGTTTSRSSGRTADARTSSDASTRPKRRSSGGSSSCRAEGHGLKAIAKRLNDEGAPSPRAQRGRSQTWAPSLGARSAATGRCTAA